MLSSKLFHANKAMLNTVVIDPVEPQEITVRNSTATVVFRNEIFTTCDEVDERLVNAKLLESMSSKGFGIKSIHANLGGYEYVYMHSKNGIVIQGLRLPGHTKQCFFSTENSTNLFTSVESNANGGDSSYEGISSEFTSDSEQLWDFLTSDLSILEFKASHEDSRNGEGATVIVNCDSYLQHPDIDPQWSPTHFLYPLAVLVKIVTGNSLERVELECSRYTQQFTAREYEYQYPERDMYFNSSEQGKYRYSPEADGKCLVEGLTLLDWLAGDISLNLNPMEFTRL